MQGKPARLAILDCVTPVLTLRHIITLRICEDKTGYGGMVCILNLESLTLAALEKPDAGRADWLVAGAFDASRQRHGLPSWAFGADVMRESACCVHRVHSHHLLPFRSLGEGVGVVSQLAAKPPHVDTHHL